MSSIGNSTITPYNFQLVVDALGDYLNQTGIDLSQNPFVEKLQLSNTTVRQHDKDDRVDACTHGPNSLQVSNTAIPIP